MHSIDLNCDLGESFGAYTIGLDETVTPHVTSVNIACGWHAGDPLVMERTVALAKQCGVAIGAHPGFPDLLGFGRRELKVSPDEVYSYVKYQIGALYAFARSHHMELQHMKAHGSLYNMAGKDIRLAEAMCRACRDFDSQLILLALAGSKMEEAAQQMGVPCARGIFRRPGRLPRWQPGPPQYARRRAARHPGGPGPGGQDDPDRQSDGHRRHRDPRGL